VWYDPSAYPTAVSGVIGARNWISEVAAANNPQTDAAATDAFGPIGQALAAFH
jgi:hypothetical protein